MICGRSRRTRRCFSLSKRRGTLSPSLYRGIAAVEAPSPGSASPRPLALRASQRGRCGARPGLSSAGTQSLDKIVESYRQLVEEKGGVTLFTGRFTGGVVDANPRSEQQARDGASYLVRTPERELWAQVSVRSEGDEYVLVVVEKGPLQLKTKPLTTSELKKSLAETGKAIVYVNFNSIAPTCVPTRSRPSTRRTRC